MGQLNGQSVHITDAEQQAREFDENLDKAKFAKAIVIEDYVIRTYDVRSPEERKAYADDRKMLAAGVSAGTHCINKLDSKFVEDGKGGGTWLYLLEWYTINVETKPRTAMETK